MSKSEIGLSNLKRRLLAAKISLAQVVSEVLPSLPGDERGKALSHAEFARLCSDPEGDQVLSAAWAGRVLRCTTSVIPKLDEHGNVYETRRLDDDYFLNTSHVAHITEHNKDLGHAVGAIVLNYMSGGERVSCKAETDGSDGAGVDPVKQSLRASRAASLAAEVHIDVLADGVIQPHEELRLRRATALEEQERRKRDAAVRVRASEFNRTLVALPARSR